MRYVCRIDKEGYKTLQQNVVEEAKSLGLSKEERDAYFRKHMLVKEDKKHRCYHYSDLIEDLHEMSAEDFAIAIRGKPENLLCKTGFDLLFKANTRFQSVNSFRECLMQKREDIEKIQSSPIILLDPAQVATHRKFKYALD